MMLFQNPIISRNKMIYFFMLWGHQVKDVHKEILVTTSPVMIQNLASYV